MSNLSDKQEDTIRIIRDICCMGTHRAYLFLKVNRLKMKEFTKLFPVTITPESFLPQFYMIRPRTQLNVFWNKWSKKMLLLLKRSIHIMAKRTRTVQSIINFWNYAKNTKSNKDLLKSEIQEPTVRSNESLEGLWRCGIIIQNFLHQLIGK